MFVYDLTGLTRGAGEQRRVVVQSFDIPLQSLVLAICGFVVALPFMVVLFPLLGYFALLVVVVVELAMFWLFRWRSRSGLRLKNYQSILDRRRSHLDQFLVCGQPYDITRGLAITVVSSSLPSVHRRQVGTGTSVETDLAASIDDLFSLTMSRTAATRPAT